MTALPSRSTMDGTGSPTTSQAQSWFGALWDYINQEFGQTGSNYTSLTTGGTLNATLVPRMVYEFITNHNQELVLPAISAMPVGVPFYIRSRTIGNRVSRAGSDNINTGYTGTNTALFCHPGTELEFTSDGTQWSCRVTPSPGFDMTSYLSTTVTAGAFVVGRQYEIVSVGTTSFTSIGASANTVGTVFTATGVGSGTGTAVPSVQLNIGEKCRFIRTGGVSGDTSLRLASPSKSVFRMLLHSDPSATSTNTWYLAPNNATVGTAVVNNIISANATAASVVSAQQNNSVFYLTSINTGALFSAEAIITAGAGYTTVSAHGKSQTGSGYFTAWNDGHWNGVLNTLGVLGMNGDSPANLEITVERVS